MIETDILIVGSGCSGLYCALQLPPTKKILIITKENGKEKRITANYNRIIDGDEPDVVIRRGDMVIVK